MRLGFRLDSSLTSQKPPGLSDSGASCHRIQYLLAASAKALKVSGRWKRAPESHSTSSRRLAGCQGRLVFWGRLARLRWRTVETVMKRFLESGLLQHRSARQVLAGVFGPIEREGIPHAEYELAGKAYSSFSYSSLPAFYILKGPGAWKTSFACVLRKEFVYTQKLNLKLIVSQVEDFC